MISLLLAAVIETWTLGYTDSYGEKYLELYYSQTECVAKRQDLGRRGYTITTNCARGLVVQ